MRARALKELMLHPGRYMRTKGFGVHSPFAFRFLRMVIGERTCSYYAYEAISVIARSGGDRVSEHDLRLFFRMVCALSPTTVSAVGYGAEKAMKVARLASGHIRPGTAADLQWIGRGALPDKASVAALATNGAAALVIGNKEAVEQIRSAMTTAGMVFLGGAGRAAIVGSRHLPRQDYSVLF